MTFPPSATSMEIMLPDCYNSLNTKYSFDVHLPIDSFRLRIGFWPTVLRFLFFPLIILENWLVV